MTRKNYILALDEGTTGCTAIIFDTNGQAKGRGYREITQHFPHPGWVEHDPQEIFARSIEACKEAIARSNISSKDIAGMGITNQRETAVLWNKRTLVPVSNAIVWQCKRTRDRCESLRSAGHEPVVRDKTGLLLDPYFSATKIAWLLETVPDCKKLISENRLAFGTIDSWLVANLTKSKEHVTDYTNASRTSCLNIHTKDWDPQLLSIFGLPSEIFPRVQPSCSYFGEVDASIFGHAFPIFGMVGDQQASLFGHGCTKPRTAKCTFGTGAFAMTIASKQRDIHPSEGLLLTLACDEQGQPTYALEGSIFMAGAIVQWLRDQLGIIENASQTQELAQSLSDNGGVYLVPAFAGLGTPYWNPYARAAIFGMTRGTGKAHLARASLEAIAYQTNDLMQAFSRAQGASIEELHIDGGVVHNSFFTQFLSDVLQSKLKKPSLEELTVYGAAKLCSIHPEVKDHFQFRSHSAQSLSPSMERARRDALLLHWKNAVDRVIDYAAKK